MELANQIQPNNPLDDDPFSSDHSTMNLKVINNEYSIQLDSDTIKYLSMKKKAPLSVSNEEEMRMKIISRFSYLRLCFFSS